MLKTWEPQGQTCTGPKALRSAPKGSGRVSVISLRRRILGSLGRRNRRVTVLSLSQPPKGCSPCLIRLTAHIVTI